MFTGNEDQSITLDVASALTAEYRHNNPGATLGHYFSRKTLEDILNQTNCVGARIYYGTDRSTGAKELVIVGVKSNEEDLYNGVLGDRTFKCPPYCGPSNPLNS